MIYKVRDRGHREPIITEHLKGAIDYSKIFNILHFSPDKFTSFIAGLTKICGTFE